MTEAETGVSYATAAGVAVAIIGLIGKLIHLRLKKSECWGIKVEMDNNDETDNNRVETVEV